MTDDMLTLAQAAKLKGVSRVAIWKAVWEKRLPATQFAGRWFVKPSDLAGYVPQTKKETQG